MEQFRPMRRFRQQLSDDESVGILKKATSGTLALLGDNGYPYSALSGHKVDAIRNSDKASFCVIEQDNIHPKEFTTYFRSVIAFGRIHIVEDDAEKMQAARLLSERYNPGDDEGFQKELEKGFARMLAIRFDIEHLTGKDAIELVRKK